ncbi:EAL domain-containing protein [Neobacillus sp. D3-1R]|uniref:EAL domain-containing protein n=1 Tax=Neobacillus sp. D3-1R TaxID=3445778 RepID=UPI003F9F4373
MSTCSACLTSSLVYQIQIEDSYFLELTVCHFQRNGHQLTKKDHILYVNESIILDFYDFCHDHMDGSAISFRIAEEPWRPLHEIDKLIKGQWIDDIIQKKLVTVHIQPIVDTDTEIFGYEILSRFSTSDGQSKSPFEVFTAARERNRLYALDKLCRMNAVKHAAYFDGKAFINFIPTSIYSPEHCLKSTVALANQLQIDPSRFVFEVVETEKVDDIDHLKTILKFYKEKGFQYALDDVGEGFSTVDVLTELKPQFMKLDRKFVDGVAKDTVKQAMALKLLHAANEIGSTPLAEGIEDQDDFEWLRASGYQLFQGYLFGKPAPIN